MFRTPSGRPDSISSSPSRTAERGTFSEGFRTNVLPQASATGIIQSGTMTGKLNGVIPAHTPTGWRTVSQSTSRGDVRQRLAHQEAGDPAGELDHLDPALDRGPRLAQRLAVLAGHEPGQLVGLVDQPLAKPEEHTRPLDGRRLGPGRQGRGGRPTARSTSSAVPSGTRAISRPVEGLKTAPKRSDRDSSHRPPTSIGTVSSVCAADMGHLVRGIPRRKDLTTEDTENTEEKNNYIVI